VEHLATLLNVGRARGFEEKADLRGCRVNVRPQRPDCFAYSVLLLLARFFSGSPSHHPSGSLSPLCGSMGPILSLNGNGKRNGAGGCSVLQMRFIQTHGSHVYVRCKQPAAPVPSRSVLHGICLLLLPVAGSEDLARLKGGDLVCGVV